MSTPKELSYQPRETPVEICEGLEILQKYTPLVSRSTPNGFRVRFKGGGSAMTIKVRGEDVEITYSRPSEAYRALGMLSGRLLAGETIRNLTQDTPFTLISVMLDVSRNAVMKPGVLKAFLARFALMGINGFMLYAECNYEIPGEPFWGYNIGGYSIQELTELDRYAGKLGIEMFPCIQALAHLRRALQWEAYGAVKDTETVLLVDEEETYRFLE